MSTDKALLRTLRATTENDVLQALEGAYITLPVTTPTEAVELLNILLDHATGERKLAEADDAARVALQTSLPRGARRIDLARHVPILRHMDSINENAPFHGFQVPDPNASTVELEAAVVALNSVELTPYQMFAGYHVAMAADEGHPDMQALRAWCQTEDLSPADVAAEAIVLRIGRVLAKAHGIGEMPSHEDQLAVATLPFDILELQYPDYG